MKLIVPQSFKEISVGQLQQLAFLRERKLERYQYLAHLVAITCKVDYEIALALPLNTLLEIELELQFIFKPHAEAPIKDKYKLNNIYYHVMKDLSLASAGQYIDAKTIIDSGNIINNLHKLIAIFLLPYGYKHSLKVYNKTCEDVYNHLSVEDAISLQVFFCNLSDILTLSIQTSIVDQSVKQAFKTMDLKNTGAGSLH